ncbi:hypothetical protein CTAYLR_001909 [Chrysophaeum taylorii]|uniref:Uncharacterized protein n=1 Tax=Chrysophaeum taylorii TaxID=2483200 RepID=A0AAD7XI06_9STRA|nr:hypothetical protein CTAYLR_001909 [Chrysophaeum taylorii]
MRLMSAGSLESWAPLIEACNAYAQFTGGRFVAEDFFSDETTKSSCDGEGFEEARAAARDAVLSFRAVVREPDLVAEYQKAYALTVHEAALATMASALRALERLPEAEAENVDVTAADAEDLPTLSTKVAAAAAFRASNSRPSHQFMARLRAASFVADFGAACGLEKISCPDDDRLLQTFYDKLNAAEDDVQGVYKAMHDAYAPYADLLGSGFDTAKAWCKTNPEVTTIAAVGAVAIGVGIALFGLLRSSRAGARPPRR